MTDTVTSQNIDISYWDTLYILLSSINFHNFQPSDKIDGCNFIDEFNRNIFILQPVPRSTPTPSPL